MLLSLIFVLVCLIATTERFHDFSDNLIFRGFAICLLVRYIFNRLMSIPGASICLVCSFSSLPLPFSITSFWKQLTTAGWPVCRIVCVVIFLFPICWFIMPNL